MKTIKHPSSFQTLALLDQAVVSGGNFLLGVLLARWLGLADFGTFALLWMGVLFLLGVQQAFVTQPLTTLFASKGPDGQAGYLHQVFQMQTLLSWGVAALAVMVGYVLKMAGLTDGWFDLLPTVGLLTALYLLQDTLRKLFFVKKQAHQPLWMDVLLYATLFLLLFILKTNGLLWLHTALLAMLVAYAASCLLGNHFLKKQSDGIPPSLEGAGGGYAPAATLQTTIREHYRYSVWLLGTALLQWFSGNFFLVAAGGLLGTVAVGALRMAQNIVGLAHVLFLTMENIVPAEAARQFYLHGREQMNAYLWRTSLMVALPFVLLMAVLGITCPWLTLWLYGPEYQAFSYLVWVYAGLYLFVYAGYPLRFALRATQQTQPIFTAYCLSAVAGLLLAFPVVRQWGLPGVMAGLIGSQVIALAVYVFSLVKKAPGGYPAIGATQP